MLHLHVAEPRQLLIQQTDQRLEQLPDAGDTQGLGGADTGAAGAELLRRAPRTS